MTLPWHLHHANAVQRYATTAATSSCFAHVPSLTHYSNQNSHSYYVCRLPHSHRIDIVAVYASCSGCKIVRNSFTSHASHSVICMYVHDGMLVWRIEGVSRGTMWQPPASKMLYARRAYTWASKQTFTSIKIYLDFSLAFCLRKANASRTIVSCVCSAHIDACRAWNWFDFHLFIVVCVRARVPHCLVNNGCIYIASALSSFPVHRKRGALLVMDSIARNCPAYPLLYPSNRCWHPPVWKSGKMEFYCVPHSIAHEYEINSKFFVRAPNHTPHNLIRYEIRCKSVVCWQRK